MRALGLVLACLMTFSCNLMINRYAFHPDRDYTIPRGRLPPHARLVEITEPDGLVIQGLLLKHGQEREALVLYFHGNAGNMYHRMGEAQRLFELGPDVLIVSYRGYAGSQGSPTEAGIYKDGRAALGFAIHDLGYREEDLLILGRSLGTTVAVELAQHRNLRGIILVTPFTRARDLVAATLSPAAGSLAGNAFASIDKIVNLRSPLLVLHGTEDSVIPFNLGKALYDAYEGRKQFAAINRGEHNDLEFVDPDGYYGSIRDFISGTGE